MMNEEDSQIIQNATLAILGIVATKDLGVVQVAVPFTPHKTGVKETYHIVIYKESSGYHEDIQKALSDGKDDDQANSMDWS
jgi:hypothetical protein